MDDNLTCSICFHLFSLETIPIILICGHSICLKCLIQNEKSLIKDEDELEDDEDESSEGDETEETNIKITKCPICRKEINKRVCKLTINFSIVFLSLHNKKQRIEYIFCENCDKLSYFNQDDKKHINLVFSCIKNFHSLITNESIVDLELKLKDMISYMQSDNIKSLVSLTFDIQEVFRCIKERLSLRETSLKLKFRSQLESNISKYANFCYDSKKEVINNIYIEDLFKISNDIKINRQLNNHYYGLDNKEKEDKLFSQAIFSSIKYYIDNYDEVERKYTAVFNIDNPNEIILYNIETNIISKYTIPLCILNRSLSIVVDSNSNGNIIYFIGGSFGELKENDYKCLKNIFSYNIKDNQTSFVKNMKIGRHAPIVVECYIKQMKYYNCLIIGGTDENASFISSGEWLTNTNNNYNNVPNLPVFVFSGCGFCMNEVIYLLCSDADETYLFSWNYTIVGSKWHKIDIEFDYFIYNYVFAPLNNSQFIIFGGLCSDIDDEEQLFNSSYYIINIDNRTIEVKSMPKTLSKAEFLYQPAYYKYQIVALDSFNEDYDENFKFTYNIQMNWFSMKEIN